MPGNKLLDLARAEFPGADEPGWSSNFTIPPWELEAQRADPKHQEPQTGRLPTADERAGGNPVHAWWLGQGDKMRDLAINGSEAARALKEKAGQPAWGDTRWAGPGDLIPLPQSGSHMHEFATRALTEAPLGARGGYQIRYTLDTPDPFLLPGGGWNGTQPLVLSAPKGTPLDGMTVPQGALSLMGPLQGKTRPGEPHR